MNWAILATGTIAAKFAETVNGMKGEDRLAACGSRSREKAEAFGRKYGIPRAYGSYEELLRDEEVDAVYVATPNNMHYENCMACLEAGKHVLCEKPFTTNVTVSYTHLDVYKRQEGLTGTSAFSCRKQQW